MIRPIDIKINAAHPELPLFEAVTYVDSPSAVFVHGVPRSCGNWAITRVYVSATYPDGSTRTTEAMYSAAGIWVATLPAPSVGGRTQNGFVISADGTTETGDAVTGYILGMGDFAVLSIAPIPNPGDVSWQVRYFDAPPTPPKKGDMAPVDGSLEFYDGTAWVPFVSLADYYTKTQTNNLLAAKLDKSGGTLTGPLVLTGDKKISFFDTSGTRELRIGLGTDYFSIELYSYGSLSLSWRTPFSSGRFALAVDNATFGHLAALDAYGNLIDSGKKPADFAPATNIQKSALASDVQSSLDKADGAATKADATLTEKWTPTFALTDAQKEAFSQTPGASDNDYALTIVPPTSGESYTLYVGSYNAAAFRKDPSSITNLIFVGGDARLALQPGDIVATLSGYQLGTQTDKPLQPAGDYAPATKTVTAMATETMLPPDCFPIRYTDGGATVELSAEDVEFTPQFVLRVKGATPVIALATFALPSGGQTIADFSQHPDITFGGRAPTTGVWPAYLREGETYSKTYPVVYGNDIAPLAPLASPAFTGAPTAPTPASGDNSGKVATTAFVKEAVEGATPDLDYVMRVDPETGGIYYTTPDNA